MAAIHTCAQCGAPFEAYRSDARFCSDAHRARASREANVRRREAAEDLLRRMTEALASGGDTATLAELQRQAARFLG